MSWKVDIQNLEKAYCVLTHCILGNYTPGIYADGYIVFVFPFVCSSVCMFVRSFVLPSRL